MICRLIFLAAVFTGLGQAATAQNFPTRPITVVVPFTPGGGMDFILRGIQSRWESALGQPLIIENKPGATGNIGNAYVAKAEPDGYTLLITQVNIGVFPHIFPKLAYDPLNDFTPIGGIAETPGACVINPAARNQSFADIIAEAKANPGKISYGTNGNGSPSHLQAEMIAKSHNVKMTQVPYKGPTLALNDVLGGFIEFICLASVNPMPLIREGKLKAIAVTSGKRSKLLPDVPTLREVGAANMNESSRFILLAPAKTPQPIVDRLSSTLKAILSDPAIEQMFLPSGFEVSNTSAAEVRAQLQEQYDVWGPLIKEMNLKLE